MKILIAPDSFKDSLAANEVAESIRKGVVTVLNNAEVKIIPMADGGEGSLKTLVDSTNGRVVDAMVHDPLMREIKSQFGILGDRKTGIIEIAAASGLQLLKLEERNPMLTTSYGTGELILKALDEGCREFIIALGGSAMNDGGAGMMLAFGAKLMDSKGAELSVGGGSLTELFSMDVSSVDSRLYDCVFYLACDVDNPLIGSNGASFVYGPQKGGNEEMVNDLESGLLKYSEVILKLTGKNVNVPGSGAAGGIAASFLGFFNTKIKSGFSLISDLVNLENEIQWCDLIITGEGKVDHQTLSGKVPFGVSKLGLKYNKPVLIFAGTMEQDAELLYDHGATVIVPICDKPMTIQESIKNTSQLLSRAAERTFRVLSMKSIVGKDI